MRGTGVEANCGRGAGWLVVDSSQGFCLPNNTVGRVTCAVISLPLFAEDLWLKCLSVGCNSLYN